MTDDPPTTCWARSGRTLLADAAYDSNRLRDYLAAVGAKALIKPIPRRTAPPPLDKAAYRRRNRIERFLSKLKHYRAIATRYEKHDANFLALVKLAATRIWLRAYESVSYSSAQWAEMAGVDVVVVGDSLAMIAHGHTSTIPATMDMMILHAQAVRRGAPDTFSLGCMHYQSYNTIDRALTNATRFMQAGGCDAVKPQGGRSQQAILRALVDAGIPTASDIGMAPHRVAMYGGFRVQGKTPEGAMEILEDAFAIQDAGCFMVEFEAVPAPIARLISEQLEIPTIGIGAGAGTDGQILLSYDLLGMFTDFKPKFTKRYANLTEVAVRGLADYASEVRAGTFPDEDHSYGVDETVVTAFRDSLERRRQV